MYSRENKLARKAWNHTPSTAPSPFQPRSFGIQAKSEPTQSTPLQQEVDAQGDRANPYSTNLLNIPIHQPGTEPPSAPQIGLIQAKMAEMLDKPTPMSAPSATNSPFIQRQAAGEKEDEMIQTKSEAQAGSTIDKQKPKENNTGMPNHLKAGIENLSGISMDDVKVHYNSSTPASLGALAYAQGTDIHLGSGQEQHLPHEAWHVVQQKQGRVKPTMQMKGTAINDELPLEKEADEMGAKAVQRKQSNQVLTEHTSQIAAKNENLEELPLKDLHSVSNIDNNGAVQMRTANSRGDNRRTYKLSDTVKTHIFQNQNNGSGFHSIARNRSSLINHVRQTDSKDRNNSPYRADHLDAGRREILSGKNKSMFPDGWDEDRVVDVIERALTRPDLTEAQKTRINQEGTTEDNNRPLPSPVSGKVHGKADGVRIEGIMGSGELQTAYPLI